MAKQYQTIPGFSKYEISKDGNVRNIKTKEIAREISPTTKKIFIYNDEKKRVMIKPSDLVKDVSFDDDEFIEKPVKVSNPKGSKIREILEYHSQGKTRQEIVDLGYHKTTVAIQISKALKAK